MGKFEVGHAPDGDDGTSLTYDGGWSCPTKTVLGSDFFDKSPCAQFMTLAKECYLRAQERDFDDTGLSDNRIRDIFRQIQDSLGCKGYAGPSIDSPSFPRPRPRPRPKPNSGPITLGPSGLCFVGGTQIKTEYGSERIENIHVGCNVWSYDFKKGIWALNRVTKLHESDHDNAVVTIKAGDAVVTCTHEHRFWVERGERLTSRADISRPYCVDYLGAMPGKWVRASLLCIGDTLVTRNGDRIVIESIDSETRRCLVYNLSVENNHNYAVTDTGILVHNVKP